MNIVLRIGRSILAVIVGYLVVALGTTLFFETLLGGVGYRTSSPGELVVATLGAVVSGLAGGLAAAWVAHAAAVLIPLAGDTTWVLTSGVSSDPIWFDLGGSLTLMVFAVVGGFVYRRVRNRRQTRPVHSRCHANLERALEVPCES